uniref:thiamine phosphate synthase n=1 Tax=Pararhizobium sp. IMCC3301 TaxID=3067904 RepID=UPI0027426B8E|nr:thiamine phosphate synthase [Pararhizobium sp. IMCC3301]
MVDKYRSAAQLYLVTPQFDERTEFAGLLDRVLQAAQVAALLIAPRSQGDASDSYQNDCKLLASIAQKHGAAALTLNDTQISGRAGADGIHLTGNLKELKDVIGRFQPAKIVGAGTIRDRHDAMEKGEALPDYLLFGDMFETEETSPDSALELAAWWADLFEIPCVAMAGKQLKDVENAVATRADFIGLNGFVWQHADGPEAAIKAAHKLLQND